MNRFDLIIFDMDGLMYDTEAVAFRAFKELAEEQGFHATDKDYLESVGLDMRATCDLYRRLYGEDLDAEQLYTNVGKRMFEIIDREGIPMKPGLIPLIEAIEKKGLRKVVASGSAIETIEKYLRQSNLTQHFDCIYSSDDVKRGKPFPDVFLRVCDQEGIDPARTLVLEDSFAGVEAAVAGGMEVIGIPDLIPFTEEIKEKCLAVGETLEDVIPHIG